MEELKKKITERIAGYDEQIKSIEDLLTVKRNELIAHIQAKGELKTALGWISESEDAGHESKDIQVKAEGRE